MNSNVNANNGEGKKSRRSVFNAIDISILLLILICAIGIYVRYERENSVNAGDGASYTVEFVCEKVRYTTVDYINVGDEIYFGGTNKRLGTVSGTVVSRPSSEEIDSDGKKVTVYYPSDTVIDISGSFSVNGVMTENGFLIGGDTYIAPNSVIEISGRMVDMKVRVVSIKVADGE